MSYSTISTMQHSNSLLQRCTASVASEAAADPSKGDASVANSWVTQRAWDLAATPGWAAAWESAEAGGITDPGASETVITDSMILGRVQPLMTQYPLSALLAPPVIP